MIEFYIMDGLMNYVPTWKEIYKLNILLKVLEKKHYYVKLVVNLTKHFPNEYDVAFKELNKLDEICSHMNLLKIFGQKKNS